MLNLTELEEDEVTLKLYEYLDFIKENSNNLIKVEVGDMTTIMDVSSIVGGLDVNYRVNYQKHYPKDNIISIVICKKEEKRGSEIRLNLNKDKKEGITNKLSVKKSEFYSSYEKIIKIKINIKNEKFIFTFKYYE